MKNDLVKPLSFLISLIFPLSLLAADADQANTKVSDSDRALFAASLISQGPTWGDVIRGMSIPAEQRAEIADYFTRHDLLGLKTPDVSIDGNKLTLHTAKFRDLTFTMESAPIKRLVFNGHVATYNGGSFEDFVKHVSTAIHESLGKKAAASFWMGSVFPPAAAQSIIAEPMMRPEIMTGGAAEEYPELAAGAAASGIAGWFNQKLGNQSDYQLMEEAQKVGTTGTCSGGKLASIKTHNFNFELAYRSSFIPDSGDQRGKTLKDVLEITQWSANSNGTSNTNGSACHFFSYPDPLTKQAEPAVLQHDGVCAGGGPSLDFHNATRGVSLDTMRAMMRCCSKGCPPPEGVKGAAPVPGKNTQ